MKRTVLMLLVIVTFFLFTAESCTDNGANPNTDKKQSERTEQLMAELDRQIGMPNIVNFQQKKIMKLIMEECDKENLICYAYIKSDYQGKLTYIGKCIGYGVPFSAQYTNPERYFDDPNGSYDSGSLKIPQPDPNGLFMPTSSSATWLMMLDKTGKPHPVYLEPEIVVSPFPLDI